MNKTTLSKNIRKLHRKLGIVIGIQLLLWSLGGVIFSWIHIDNIRGDYESVPEEPISFKSDSALYPIVELINISKLKDIYEVKLGYLLGMPVYRLYKNADDVEIYDAYSGRLLSPISEETALKIAGKDFEADIEPIFTNNCTSRGCHVSGNEGSGLNLQVGNSYGEITGMNTTSNAPLVIAGSPDTSPIIWKLEGVDNNGGNVFGSRMPLGGPFLSQTTIDLIRQWISDGAVLSVLDDEKSLPEGFALEQNFPNPFNPQTTIEYTIARRGEVKLTLYNVLGQEITVLVDEILNQGVYSAAWDAADQSTGLYFYTLEAGGGKNTKKLLFIK